MKNMSKNTSKQTNVKKKKTNKKANYILWAGLIVLLIPIIILVYILFGSMEKTGEPISGNRFDNALNPKISEKQIKDIKAAMTFENIETVSVNLKTATMRVNINTVDSMALDQIQAIANQAYENVNKILPIGTYFTDSKKYQMYDLEISVYNLIPDEKTQVEQIYIIKSKSASTAEPQLQIVSQPKDSDVANSLLNPDTSTVPQAPAATVE